MTRLTHQTTSGTPAYMAPEQHEGLVKKESDIYAMGVCLYEMLVGKLPFDGEDYQGMKRSQGYKAVSAVLPWLPAGIDNVIDRALAPEPSQRYADALELYDALKDL
jgi:serine/threonine-protein kinase